jgi:hypothetical protein
MRGKLNVPNANIQTSGLADFEGAHIFLTFPWNVQGAGANGVATFDGLWPSFF